MKQEWQALSPLDGRYRKDLTEFSEFFSEEALIKYRGEIEKRYLIALLKILKKITPVQEKAIARIEIDPEAVKKIEKKTKHDVKAVEYYLRFKVKGLRLKVFQEFIHFALTSEDINNIAYSWQLKDALNKIYLPALEKLIQQLTQMAKQWTHLPLLSLTHGQPATPTTLGKEMNVFAYRLKQQFLFPKLSAKFGGAVGNWAAHQIAYPGIDWLKFSQKFVESFGLEFNPLTTQIEPRDRLAEVYQQIIRINNILRDLAQDMWLYISRGIFRQRVLREEVGSSTMPHKVNPIAFENAEGNAGLSAAIFDYLANKLPVSRLQRDLSDSTVLRNQGVALGYSLLSLKNILRGLERIAPDKKKMQKELNENWEVLAEAIQTILRKCGIAKPYEKLKELTRGKKIDKNKLKKFIANLKIPREEKEKLQRLTPELYIGLSEKLCVEFLAFMAKKGKTL